MYAPTYCEYLLFSVLVNKRLLDEACNEECVQVTASREGGRAEALQQQLATLEVAKDTLERRLQAIHSALRTLTHAYAAPTNKGTTLELVLRNKGAPRLPVAPRTLLPEVYCL